MGRLTQTQLESLKESMRVYNWDLMMVFESVAGKEESMKTMTDSQ